MLNDELKARVRNQTTGYIAAALSLVAGLAWNDAIRSLIEVLFPLDTSGILIKFVYAIIITVVVVFVSTSILKSSDKK
ncbi:hypothetical protein IT398_02075 [Candidatus Nomurabacteria bacterium]|nr:hypothetical protein [Candidatus Nomurabacteria bacterium]